MGSGPVHDRLARTLTRALPGGEHSTGEVDGGGVVSFDLLIRMLANWFREQLPAGWIMHASGRSGGFRLRVPNSRSEEDYAIDMGWISPLTSAVATGCLRSPRPRSPSSSHESCSTWSSTDKPELRSALVTARPFPGYRRGARTAVPCALALARRRTRDGIGSSGLPRSCWDIPTAPARRARQKRVDLISL